MSVFIFQVSVSSDIYTFWDLTEFHHGIVKIDQLCHMKTVNSPCIPRGGTISNRKQVGHIKVIVPKTCISL